MSKTTYLGLEKPAESEFYRIQHFNDNADIIDKKVHELESKVGSPFIAQTAAQMTDKTRVYVYVGSESGYTKGNWYYHNGSKWISGGVYNSQGVDTDKNLDVEGKAADAKATGDRLSSITEEIQDFEGATLNDAGARGLVPAPEEGMTQHVLTSVGTWEKFVAQWFDDGTGVRIGLGSSYSCDITQATGRKIGFMGADDKEKLDKYPEYGELEKTIQGLENKIDAMQQIITKLVAAPTLTADTNGNLQITENEEG